MVILNPSVVWTTMNYSGFWIIMESTGYICVYPLTVKSGWLENPRTKWRFIAGEIIYTYNKWIMYHVSLPINCAQKLVVINQWEFGICDECHVIVLNRPWYTDRPGERSWDPLIGDLTTKSMDVMDEPPGLDSSPKKALAEKGYPVKMMGESPRNQI